MSAPETLLCRIPAPGGGLARCRWQLPPDPLERKGQTHALAARGPLPRLPRQQWMRVLRLRAAAAVCATLPWRHCRVRPRSPAVVAQHCQPRQRRRCWCWCGREAQAWCFAMPCRRPASAATWRCRWATRPGSGRAPARTQRRWVR
eukprot:364374-Chlamydomonas_euryale.AAC.4